MAWYDVNNLVNDVGSVVTAPVTGGASLAAFNSSKNPYDAAKDAASTVKSDIQGVLQGPPPTDPSKTAAGKTAQTYEQTAIDASNNFTPQATPTTGKDPAKAAALKQAQDNLAAAQAAYTASITGVAQPNPINPLAPPLAPPPAGPEGNAQQQAALAAAQKAVDTAQAAYDNSIDPRLLTTSHTVASAPTVTAPTISATPIGAIPQVSAATVDPNSAPQVSGGNYSYNPYLIDPSSIKDAVAGGASGAGVTATTIDPNAGQVAPVADIDISGSAGRQAQLQALALDKTAAEGSAPSAAQILMQQGIDQSVGSAYGLAASLQGRNPGEALRQGVTTAADLSIKSVAQSAALRATEMAEARGAFGTLASQIAAGDIQVAQSNQTKDLQVAITNANNKLDALKANQTAQLQAGIATAANATAASIATLQAQTTVAVANLNKSVAIDVANQTAANDASKSNAANALAAKTTDAVNQVNLIMQNMRNAQDANDQNAANALKAQLADAQNALAAAQSNQTALLDASKTNATNQTNVNIANTSLAQSSDQFNAQQIRGVDTQNQNASLSEQQLNQAMQLGLSGQAFNAVALGLQTQAQFAQAQAAYNAGFAQLLAAGGKIAAGAGAGGPAGAPPAASPPISYGANGSPILG